MPNVDHPGVEAGDRWFPGWKTVAAVLVFYAGCLALATYPVVLRLGSKIPGGSANDPTHCLVVMRWTRDCLLEGRSPFVQPDLHYPVGAPLGLFDPTRLQSLLYLPLSLLTDNDTLCYNLIWSFAFLSTGLGTFLLCWYVVRDRSAAALGGLLAMLSGPMMLHAHGHLVLIQLGFVPLFLLAWMRLLDAPTRGRLLAAVGLLTLVAASAHYFIVLIVFPAAWYVLYRALAAGRAGVLPYLRNRLPWLVAFVALSLPCLLLLFSNQIWVLAHQSMDRPREQFDYFRAAPWSYLLPTQVHLLGALMPVHPHDVCGLPAIESVAYLGIVSLLLLHHALTRRVRFERAGYWWTVIVLLVVLSLGSYTWIGTYRLGLPAGWLQRWFPPMALLRVPARFNLFAAVLAAVPAAAGAHHLLARLPRRGHRALAFLALAAVVVIDLGVYPFPTQKLPGPPACYAEVLGRDPSATFLEAPVFESGGYTMMALTGYWGSIHRAPTTGGYSAHSNLDFDDRVARTSPLLYTLLFDPNFPGDPGARSQFGVVHNASFDDYLWLHLTANKLRYVVLHKWDSNWFQGFPIHYSHLMERLRGAAIFENVESVVYDRERLPRPTGPVLLPTDGWHHETESPPPLTATVTGRGGLALYNPDPSSRLIVALKARSLRRTVRVRLTEGGRELASWPIGVEPGPMVLSPVLRLPAGLHDLALVVEAESPPAVAGSKRPEPARLNVEAIGVIDRRGSEPEPASGRTIAGSGQEDGAIAR